MDFGDIIIAIFIVTSILSSLAGGKKKRQGKPQARPRPRPRQAPLPSGPPEQAPSPPARTDGATTMEDILRQLGLDVGPEPQIEIEPEPAPVLLEGELPRDRVGREIPQVMSLEDESIDSVVERGGPEHQSFHNKYVKAFEETEIKVARSRARVHLNSRSLREAVILQEILGPPKGLQ